MPAEQYMPLLLRHTQNVTVKEDLAQKLVILCKCFCAIHYTLRQPYMQAVHLLSALLPGSPHSTVTVTVVPVVKYMSVLLRRAPYCTAKDNL